MIWKLNTQNDLLILHFVLCQFQLFPYLQLKPTVKTQNIYFVQVLSPKNCNYELYLSKDSQYLLLLKIILNHMKKSLVLFPRYKGHKWINEINNCYYWSQLSIWGLLQWIRLFPVCEVNMTWQCIYNNLFFH